MNFCQNYVHFNIILFIFQLWSWRLHLDCPNRSLLHVPILVDEELLVDAPTHTNFPHYVLVAYKDECDRKQSDKV